MSKKIQLSIPKPCHEDWDAMSPVDKGKFCGSCEKQVVDFSTMSDRQVAEFFKKPSTGSVCGRFMADQLERDIEIPKKRLPWFKYFFSIALPAFFFAKAGAQNGQKMGKVKPATRDTMPTNINQEYRTMGMVALPGKFIPVEKGNQKGEWGKVVDAQTGLALPGAEIFLFSTIGKEKINVKKDGSFIIDIYRKITVDRIEISMPGYISKTLNLTDFLKAANAKEVIQMERDEMIVGKIAMVDCVKPVMGDTTAYTLKGEIQVVDTRKKIIFEGIVQDENTAPVQGASVRIKGTKVGVATDNYGRFRISVAKEDVLIITGGIEPKEIGVDNKGFATIIVARRVVMGGILTKKTLRKRSRHSQEQIIKNTVSTKLEPIIVPVTNPITVFPNPISAGSSITIEWKQTGEGYYNLELINQAGQAVHQREIWIDADAKLLNFDTPVAAAGSYFLVLTNKKTGKKYSEKIIIQ